MLRSTIHLTTCRGRRILVIYYVKHRDSPAKTGEISVLIFTGSFTGNIKTCIKCIEILFIQLFLKSTKCFTETLEVNDFPGSQESDRICYFRNIPYNPKNVVISGTSFLFWGDFVRTTLHNII